MGEVLHFVKQNNEWRKAKDATACESPIGVRRARRTAMLVDFRTDCFSESHLDLALDSISKYQAYWFVKKIRSGKNGYLDRDHLTYFVSVDSLYAVDADRVLSQICDLIVRAVYQEEARVKAIASHDVRELVKPRQPNLAEGLYIAAKTTKILREAGIRSLKDLILLTREDLCRIPGMTTKEVYKIECALASRGCYLSSKI